MDLKKSETQSGAATTPGRPASPSPTGVVRRKEAARILHISETTLRRRYEGRALPVEVDEAGVHVFALSAVQAFALELQVVTTEEEPETDDVTIYAQLFELFDEKMHPIDVVKKLRTVHPDIVEKAYAQWIRMRDGLLLDRDHVHSLRQVASGHSPRSLGALQSAGDIVALVRAVLEAPPRQRVCLLCAKKSATVCSTCLGREQNTARRTQLTHERDMKKMDLDAERQRARWARETAESERQHEREKLRAHEKQMKELAERHARLTGR